MFLIYSHFFQEAAAHGKKVALLDFVAPTPQGTTWGKNLWHLKSHVFIVVVNNSAINFCCVASFLKRK